MAPGRKEADVKDLVSPRIQPAGDGEVKIEKEGYQAKELECRTAAAVNLEEIYLEKK